MIHIGKDLETIANDIAKGEKFTVTVTDGDSYPLILENGMLGFRDKDEAFIIFSCGSVVAENRRESCDAK